MLLSSLSVLFLYLERSSARAVGKAHKSRIEETSDNGRTSILKVIDAIGGMEVLDSIHGIVDSIHGIVYSAKECAILWSNHIDTSLIDLCSIYRSSTLTQTYNLYSLDQSVASAGSQIISFEFDTNGLRSRIDRTYHYNEYWTWAFPDLQPAMNMSVVVQDSMEDSFACFIQGSNNFFSPNLTFAQGYADEFLTDYLIHQSHQFALPWLLRKFAADSALLRILHTQELTSQCDYMVIEHTGLQLQLLIDPITNLLHAVRSRELHQLYGPSTSDLVLTSWSNVSVNGGTKMKFPHRFQTIYNSRFVLEDFKISSIDVNPQYEGSFFEGHAPPPNPEDQSQVGGSVPQKPAESIDYPRSEVHEFYETGLWGGPFGKIFNESSVVVDYPYPSFKNIMRIYVGFQDYVQLLVEHENGFIITDAPAHRSAIILSWLAQNRPDKRITHVVPSHHHRDHAGGVHDYLRAGATLVVPHVAKDFYGPSEKMKVETYTQDHPFVFKDSVVEFRSYWRYNNPHAEDWTFAVATKANPSDDDPFVLFNADVVNPGTDALRWDAGAARDFLIEAVKAGIPRSTLLVGSHGSSDNGTSTSELLSDVADIVGFAYPALTALDWIADQHNSPGL